MTDFLRLLEIENAAQLERTMGALEAALGIQFVDADLENNGRGRFTSNRALSADVLWLSARYGWDVHHERPRSTAAELRACRIFEFTVQLMCGRSAIEFALAERFGPARSAAQAIVYGRWIVHPNDRDIEACWLSHYETLPDWLAPPPDVALRERFLVELVGAVAQAATLDGVERAARLAPQTSGIVFSSRSDSGVCLELVPALAALELARILCWENPVGESADRYQNIWRIQRVVTASPDGVVTEPPSYGRWNVRAILDARPGGAKLAALPGRPNPFGGRYCLGPGDLVRSLQLGPY